MSDHDEPRRVDDYTPMADEELASTPGTLSDAQREELEGRSASLWADAWRQLRVNPVFLVSAFFILVFMVMAVAPQLFTSEPEPIGAQCSLNNYLERPSSEHIFGYGPQGCNYYAKTIYGARASIVVGLSVTAFAVLIAIVLGSLAGYYGKAIDAIIARITDIWFAIPLVLGALVMITALRNAGESTNPLLSAVQWVTESFDSLVNVSGIGIVWLTLVIFGWPTMLRLLRSSVIATRESEYVEAARALGAKDSRIIIRHILPNALAPVIVYATITVGVVISAEAVLSFLGVGLQLPAISWGLMISTAQNRILQVPHLLIFPGIFLSVAVFSFILMGDALRDALDPRLR